MRIVWAVLALVVMAAVTAWLLQPSDAVEVAEHPIMVVGPEGTIYNGSVHATSTPLAVLLAASEAGGFTVEWQGDGPTAFVTSIAGHANSGPGGWCYEVLGIEGWVQPFRSAGDYRLPPSAPVRWVYESGGCSSPS